ncbi:uncharacterized protein LOC110234010 [Exaiptasia diaphana]|uniref:Uncharacterized protein n=1 Tax=Exaiptasia diaphana TaxID=2652724 RepID=A0A913WW56_EXADI|nr:uncharacterized protein LOC110234010 [Exaiptasia diaphana]KXJ17449.1 hypothetical protein AC249_AIPGENE4731 [Exaiptasia diaphana]
MAKKHIRNQSTSPSTCFISSKDPAGITSHQKQESLVRCAKTSPDNCLTHARVNQLSSNPFQFVKTRFDDSANSLPRPLQTATGSEPVCQYHYYQTSTNRWMNQAEYKHQNINCWLENVLKNNQNKREEIEDFETEQITQDEEDEHLSIDDSSASCLLRAKRYKPYHACAKRDLPITDQNEMNCRQDKIMTLTTLITRHDEHKNGLKLCRNMDSDKQRLNTGKKTLRGPERGKNCQLQPNSSKSKANGKPAKEKKMTSFDIRNPNSIFLAVLEEEQLARRRLTGGWSCCATETLTGQQDELRVELENISAS